MVTRFTVAKNNDGEHGDSEAYLPVFHSARHTRLVFKTM